ncbi:MAG: hypothetical protein HQL64_01985 [Magnetococcales bacterium]|nr:hypothetical protein [Magnetococcales bacterium]
MMKYSKQRGSLAMTALVLMVALGVAGVVLSRMYQSSQSAGTQNVAGDKAFNLADAGTESILAQLKANGCDPTALSGASTTTSGGNTTTVVTQSIANQGSFTVTFQKPTGTGNTWSVTAAAVGSRRVTNFPGLNCSSGNGTYAMDRLTLGNNATVNMAPGTYYIAQLSLGNNNSLVVTPSGVVKIYVQSANIGNNANLNNGGSAANLGIYAYTSLQVGNNANIHGVMNASSGAVSIQLGNNTNLQGSVVSNGPVSLGNNDLVTYGSAESSAVTSLGVACSGGGGCPYPIVGNASLAVGNNSQINGSNVGSCGGSCNVVTSAGARQSQNVTIPALPAFVASTLANGSKTSGPLAPGQYDDITISNNGTLTFTSGGGGGGGGGTITPGSWKENF